jgi:hypothetical protein
LRFDKLDAIKCDISEDDLINSLSANRNPNAAYAQRDRERSLNPNTERASIKRIDRQLMSQPKL